MFVVQINFEIIALKCVLPHVLLIQIIMLTQFLNIVLELAQTEHLHRIQLYEFVILDVTLII
jgi:hypothetical protein